MLKRISQDGAQSFSIRKHSVDAISVLIGSIALVSLFSSTVLAEERSAQISKEQSNISVVSNTINEHNKASQVTLEESGNHDIKESTSSYYLYTEEKTKSKYNTEKNKNEIVTTTQTNQNISSQAVDINTKGSTITENTTLNENESGDANRLSEELSRKHGENTSDNYVGVENRVEVESAPNVFDSSKSNPTQDVKSNNKASLKKTGNVEEPVSDEGLSLREAPIYKGVSFRANFSNAGCVDWIKYRAREILGINIPGVGNNKYGLPGASAYWTNLAGYSKGQEPAKNALAVWEHTLGSSPYWNYGHIAYVENVEGDYVTISHGGVPNNNFNGHSGVKYQKIHKDEMRTRWTSSGFLGYIYLRETPTPPAPPPVKRYNVDQVATEAGRSISDGDYHIVSNENPRLGVDVQSANPANGTNIQLWGNSDYPDQVFTVKHLGNGVYSLLHKATGNSIDSPSMDIGANVNSYGFHGGENQQWILKPSGGISFEIVNRQSGLVMDIAGGNITQGTNIQMWEPNGTGAQKFNFVSVDADAKRTIKDGSYHIVTKSNEQMGVNEVVADAENFTDAQINSNLLDNRQLFDVKYLGNGYYSISSRFTGRKLDNYGAGTYNGNNVVFHNSNDTDAQQWIIRDAGNGYYEILTKNKNMAIDVAGASTAEGTTLHLYIRHGGDNQLWKFVQEPQSIQLGVSDKTMVLGEKAKISVKISPTNVNSKSVTWKSTDPAIVNVVNGEIVAVGVGQADVIVTTVSGDKSAVLRVTVKKSVVQGWIKDPKGYRYRNADGSYPKNTWKQVSQLWYHFDKLGYMETGWRKIGNYSYYLKSSGAMATNEWISHSFYVDKNGRWIEGRQLAIPGWKKDSKGYRYQYADGTYVQNTWKQIGGKWYHFNLSGYMATGWKQLGKYWYHFDKTGHMETGWKKIGNYSYYLKSNGVMASDEWIDNKYYVDYTGKWLPEKN